MLGRSTILARSALVQLHPSSKSAFNTLLLQQRSASQALSTSSIPTLPLQQAWRPCRSFSSTGNKRISGSTNGGGDQGKNSNDKGKILESSMKDKAAVGPFNLKAGLLFLLTGVGLFFYFQKEKKNVEERRRQETANAKVGRPRIGGPFQLVTASGHPFTHEDLLGSFSLVYFGFTNCPDICPEELDKMGEVVDRIDKKFGKIINPVFISCDPARDTVEQLARYISDFHPRMVGLTGDYDSVKSACKAYRVYFSTPPSADPMGDYLVDHSIFFYLMDPEGKFVEAFGRSVDAQEVGNKVEGFIQKWKETAGSIQVADARERVAKDGRPKVDKETLKPLDKAP